LVLQKLRAIIHRGYIAPGHVRSLVDYFAVPKGGDIRLVYNGASCGFNSSIWAPSFWLPFPKSALHTLDFGYYSIDLDFGEMFLNFPLHASLKPYSGIDLSPYKADLGLSANESSWYCWTYLSHI
jgi:hypothetical protein